MNIVCNHIDHLTAKKQILEDAVNYYMQERQKIYKMGMTGPKELTGVDTSRETVQSTSKMKFIDAVKKIDEINESKHLQQCQKELEELNNRIKDIWESIERLDGIDEKVYYLRKVEGLTQVKTAERLNISEDYVRKIERKIERQLIYCISHCTVGVETC